MAAAFVFPAVSFSSQAQKAGILSQCSPRLRLNIPITLQASRTAFLGTSSARLLAVTRIFSSTSSRSVAGRVFAEASAPDRWDPNTVYRGQFGSFVINDEDRTGVYVYRTSLAVAAAFAATAAALVNTGHTDATTLLGLFAGFCASLGVSIATIHIYLAVMHNVLKATWAVGSISALVLAAQQGAPSLVTDRWTLLLYGWVFVSLAGLFFKEAFCFGRVEAVALTFLTPLLFGGHFLNLLNPDAERTMFTTAAALFVFFAARKFSQPPADDIGDKSVFDWIHAQQKAGAAGDLLQQMRAEDDRE